MENRIGIELIDKTGKSVRAWTNTDDWQKAYIFYKQREMEIMPKWIITFLEDMKHLHDQGEL